MRIWVGADWDRDKCVVESLVDGAVRKARVGRSPAAVAAFVKRFDFDDEIVVGIEAGDPLWVQLWESAGAEVFVFDPNKAKQFAKSLSSGGAQDDGRSAHALRCQVMSDAHRAHANAPTPPALRELELRLSTLDTIGRDVGRLINRLAAALRQHHPALAAVVGTCPGMRVVRFVQAVPTPGVWTNLSAEERTQVLKGLGSAKRAALVAAAGESWFGNSPVEEEAAGDLIRATAVQLETALQAKNEARNRLEKAAANDETVDQLMTIDGLGAHLATGVALATAGADDRDAAAVRSGAAPVTVRSGTSGDRRPGVHLRRAAPAVLKKVVFLVSAQLVARHRWAKAQYRYYVSRGIPSAGAYRRVARSFLRIVQAILRTGEPFDEERYIAAVRARGVPWAFEIQTESAPSNDGAPLTTQ